METELLIKIFERVSKENAKQNAIDTAIKNFEIAKEEFIKSKTGY